MRPEILFPLFKPLTALPGVGPRLAPLLGRLVGGEKVVDLLWHLPTGLIDRRFAPKVADAPEGAVVTLTVTVDSHQAPPKHMKRLPWRVRCFDETSFLTLVFFHARADFLEKQLPPGQLRVVSGRVEVYNGERQMTHPDQIAGPEELDSVMTVQPVYPLTAGLTPKAVSKPMKAALGGLPALPEWLDPPFQRQRDFAGWQESLRAVHAPDDAAELEPTTPAHARLTYDELLANQLALALVRRQLRQAAGRAIAGDGRLREKLCAALPWKLTNSQDQAIAEIAADLGGAFRMQRLLQGDVGSGKTVVALMAMLIAVEAGAQGALMAPTEILARQQHRVLAPLAESIGVKVALLTGRDKGKDRAATLTALAAGEIDIVVGTHALFQDDVLFKDLALAVIDEQHRFGVGQRLALAQKAGDGRPAQMNTLYMTATPIPRTLALTAYGDMESSRLIDKPPGRQPIETVALPLDRMDDIVDRAEQAIARGARLYWVCPLVAESEDSDLAAAEKRHRHLAQRFGDKVGLVHGQMKGAARDAAMAAFAAGTTAILVATTVIEVGVDVPEATIMVIEHAERFGLAQLHQLRGRVGRGTGKSSCVLLYQAPLGETATARIKVMRDTDDGFRIAEEDLRLRGAGEMLGTRQSGMPDFRLARLPAHEELLLAARDDTRLILEKDPDLTGPRGKALRVLLYLFERDAAVKYLRG